MISTDPAVLTCAMCTWEPVDSARAMSRATIASSAAGGMPRRPRRVETRLAQVAMDVDEAGTYHQAARVDALAGVLAGVRAGFGDAAIGDEHIGDSVDAVRRVNHATAADG